MIRPAAPADARRGPAWQRVLDLLRDLGLKA